MNQDVVSVVAVITAAATNKGIKVLQLYLLFLRKQLASETFIARIFTALDASTHFYKILESMNTDNIDI